MRASQLKLTLKSLFEIRRAVCIEGPPGGGKTSIVKQVAKELNVPIIERHMPTLLVEDFGIPFPSESDTMLHYRLPYWFPVAGKASPNGILCFDDRNQATADIQKVLANVMQERTLHGVKMPDGWQVISTGNRIGDKAGANRILTHLRNRETVVELETNFDDWKSWAIDRKIHPSVMGFINFRTDLLHKFDPKKDRNPTPRSWVEGVSDLIGVVPKASEYECFSGAVGEGPTSEFMAFLQIYRDLPDPLVILKNAKSAKIPKKPDVLYALCSSVAYRIEEQYYNNAFDLAERLPPEFGAMMMSIIVKRDPMITRDCGDRLDKWTLDNLDIL